MEVSNCQRDLVDIQNLAPCWIKIQRVKSTIWEPRSVRRKCLSILKSLFRMAIMKQFQHRSWIAFFTQSTVKCWSWRSELKVMMEIESRLTTGLPVRGSWRSSGRMPSMSTVMFKLTRCPRTLGDVKIPDLVHWFIQVGVGEDHVVAE